MLYKIMNGTVELSGNIILNRINFEIKNKNEKLAVIGRNGSGKTTLLKLISGEYSLTHEDGVNSQIAMTGNPSIGHLKQLSFENDDRTLDEEIRTVFSRVIDMKKRLSELVKKMEEDPSERLSAEYTRLEEEFNDIGGYYYEKEYDAMLRSFGFSLEDKNKKLSEFSGGQRTKLAFIRLLLSKPDILLLDEPTNHLDIDAIEWLESYLKNYKRSVVIVSHDRMFLDKIVSGVYEIENHRLKRYNGNYTDYARQKKEDYERQLKEYNAQAKEIDRLNSIAERFMGKPTKVSMARSKLKAIEHMEKIDAPEKPDERSFHADYTPRVIPGKDILFVKELSIGYDRVLSTVSFEVKRGDRLGIIGANGLGKSTLIKTIVGAVKPISGSFRYGTNVETGYFDQQMAQYTSDKTVIDDFWDEYPSLNETEVRNALGGFLFTKDDVFKEVSMLSGGEKVRLSLCKLFMKRPNLLVLDEPTNHMDIAGKETLEELINGFEGTVIYVSHDRYFMKKTATRLLSIEEDAVRLYPFGYEQYAEEQERLKESAQGRGETDRSGIALSGSVISVDINQINDKNYDKNSGRKAENPQDEVNIKKGMLSYQAGKEASKAEKKQKKLEERIERLEEALNRKKSELENPEYASDYVKLSEIQKEADALEEELLSAMEEYMK
ncbi:MAG: ABC-F family ATP-binding cassette domain-containing protein [Lachnospiraceae bacterium]|nr:ABC-F family ATP-binding cassette domain-containing protein [Lachnospiraceae bacterium]